MFDIKNTIVTPSCEIYHSPKFWKFLHLFYHFEDTIVSLYKTYKRYSPTVIGILSFWAKKRIAMTVLTSLKFGCILIYVKFYRLDYLFFLALRIFLVEFFTKNVARQKLPKNGFLKENLKYFWKKHTFDGKYTFLTIWVY